MDEAQRGTPVVALRWIPNPSGAKHALPRMNGTILHEISETTTGRHRYFVRWENGCTFYVFAEEIQIISLLK